jgi:hypothetical protein
VVLVDILDGAAVGDHVTVKAPGVAQDILQQIMLQIRYCFI